MEKKEGRTEFPIPIEHKKKCVPISFRTRCPFYKKRGGKMGKKRKV